MGTCSIAINGEAVGSVPSNFFRIAVYLILSNPHRSALRARLRALLWPDADSEHANANLRQSLARIQQFQNRLGFTLIDRNFSSVFLAPAPGVRWDLVELLAGLDGPGTRTPLELARIYGGDLLPDLGESAPEFEDWLTLNREYLRGRLIERLTWAISDHGPTGDGDRLACAQRLLTIDPCNEQAYRVLMIKAAEAGNLQRLHGLYEQCEQRLHEQMGVRASAEIHALYSSLLQSLTSRVPAERRSSS